ncbi:MAG: hypothetical protein EOO22_17945, partial [Comamonadaceae bacterium]
PGANIVVVFDEAIVRGSGSIVLRDGSGRVVERFDAATSDRLTLDGNRLTIDPTRPLEGGTRYSIESDAGIVTDRAGNPFGKVSAGPGGYSFDTLEAGPRLVRGTAGPDLLQGSSGDDRFEGLGDIDIVRYQGPRAGYTIEHRADGSWLVQSAGEGRDLLFGVERLRFADGSLALDLGNGGHAADAARVIGAVAGPEALRDQGLVGQVLDYLDHHSLAEGTQLLVNEGLAARLAGGSDDARLVELLLRNVTGQSASVVERDGWLAYMSANEVTQAELIEFAARHESTAQRIDLVGLSDHGLPYLDTAPV